MKDTVACVTGAGQGIGRGIAHALAEAGYCVVVSDIDAEHAEKVAKEIRAKNGKAMAIACDVSDRSDVVSLFKQAVDAFGDPVHVLVNNAGIFPFVSFADMTEADWEKVMDINTKSLYYCTHEALKSMPDGGRIINISSIASLVGFSGLVHYCASKGAVNGFTQALAVELAPRNITVNAVAPGAISTPGSDAVMTSEAMKKLLESIPLKREGAPEDIAYAVRFLASPEASYITGQIITVDGGRTIQS